MQTFSPFPDFIQSAKSLEFRRLGKQRIEAKQLYQTIQIGPYQKCVDDKWIPALLGGKDTPIRKTPWFSHPACVMWSKNLGALAQYGLTICTEWRARGY